MIYTDSSKQIIQITFPGSPIAAKRARIAHYPEHTRMYDPLSREKGQLQFFAAGKMADNGYTRFGAIPIAVNLSIFYPIPASYTDKKRKALDGKWCITKPDNDNVEKFYFDVLNGVAYDDDRYIALNLTTKVYSLDPRVEIEIAALKEYS